MKNKKWKDSITNRPKIGERLLVRFLNNENFYYAIYSADDEFDVHFDMSKLDVHLISSPEEINHRNSWFKFSHRSITEWRYFQ